MARRRAIFPGAAGDRSEGPAYAKGLIGVLARASALIVPVLVLNISQAPVLTSAARSCASKTHGDRRA
jgi:hypothetical protein